ncbi:hypothetical protein QQF64_019978 [Cirrhinus molitorella]|uniref:Ig-like domain-containing protein n=1 Tax=Cirrhinus molitorella TaxID=172907 RepID=A0ABR3LH10_9TELE
MNITNADAGIYELVTSSKNHNERDPTYFAVHNVSAAEQDETKKNERENVTLYTDALKYPNDEITWYFNGILIAGDQVCTDEQCEARFRGRLHLHNQTGSLTIMDLTNKDSGIYSLQINSSRIIIIRNFTLTVRDACVRNSDPPSTPAPGLNAAVIGGILLIAAVTALICYYRNRCTGATAAPNGTVGQHECDEESGEAQNFLNGNTADHSNQSTSRPKR